MRKKLLGRLGVCFAGAALLGGLGEGSAQGQSSAAVNDDSPPAAIQDLRRQVRELQATVAEVRSEAAQYHAEVLAMRRELQEQRTPEPRGPAPSGSYPTSSATRESRADGSPAATPELRDQQQVADKAPHASRLDRL